MATEKDQVRVKNHHLKRAPPSPSLSPRGEEPAAPLPLGEGSSSSLKVPRRGMVTASQDGTTIISRDVYGQQVLPDGSLKGQAYPIAGGVKAEENPQVTTDSSSTPLVVWERDNTGDGLYDLYGSRWRLAPSSFPVLETDGNQQRPAVAISGPAHYLAVWQDDRNGDWDVYARLVKPGGSDTITVAQAVGDQNIPRVAYNPDDDEYLIVWRDARDGADNSDIYAQRVSGSGLLLSECFTITAAPYCQTLPRVAYAEGQDVYLVAWRHYTGPGDDDFDAYAQLVASTGQLMGDPLIISARSGWADRESPADIVYNTTSNKFLVLWNDLRTAYWNVWGRHVSVTGTMEDPIQITYLNSKPESHGAGAYDPNTDQYLIVWRYREYSGAPGDIRGRRMTGSGVVTASETIFIATGDADQQSPDAVYLPKIEEYTVVWGAVATQYRVYLPLVTKD